MTTTAYLTSISDCSFLPDCQFDYFETTSTVLVSQFAVCTLSTVSTQLHVQGSRLLLFSSAGMTHGLRACFVCCSIMCSALQCKL